MFQILVTNFVNMKINLILILCTLFISHTKAQSTSIKADSVKTDKIQWMSITEAFEKNKSFPKKKIFIDIYTDWCGWCKRLDATTYSHPIIIKYINTNFWAVKFDAETKDTIKIDKNVYVNPNPSVKRSTHQLAVNLLNNKMSYPTTVFLNESNNVITSVAGYFGPKDFEVVIKYFGSNEYLKQTYDQYRAQFVNEISE